MTTDVSNITPNYSDYVDNHTYYSGSIIFNPGGMSGLYQMTDSFLSTVLPSDFLKNGTVRWAYENGQPSYITVENVDVVLKEYWNLLFLLIFILLVAIVLPIVGLIFCCCRCCGNCGGTAKPSGPNKEFWSKLILSICLVVCSALLLFGVVCAFGSNQDMQKGTKTFPDNARSVFSDSLNYLDSTSGQAIHLLQTNYKEFSDPFKAAIHDSGKNVIDQLSIGNPNEIINEIFDFVQLLPNIRDNLNKFSQSVDNLKVEIDGATTGMNKIKTDVSNILNTCDLPQCKSTVDEVSKFQININVNQIPDISKAVSDINGLNIDDITVAAQSGKDALVEVESHINTFLDNIFKTVDDQVDTVGNTINDNLNIMKDLVKNLTTEMNKINTTLEDGYTYLNDYYPYFYYVGIAISIVLLTVVVCLFLGIVFGLFGRRPTRDSSGCLNKKTGSRFLISATILIFIFVIVIGLITAVMLLFGLATSRGICYPLRHPTESTVFALLEEYSKHSLTSILDKCSENKSIYEVFDLKNQFDIDEITKNLNINTTLESILNNLKKNIDNVFPDNFQFLDDNSLKILNNLATISPDIQVDAFEKQLNQSVLNENLDGMISSLQEVSKLLSVVDPPSAAEIDREIVEIQNFNTNILQKLINDAKSTLDLAIELDTDMKMNSNSFSEALKTFLPKIDEIQKTLAQQKSYIAEAGKDFGDLISTLIYGYIDRFKLVTTKQLGQCGPLYAAYNAILISTCDMIVLPWSGFGLSLFISLITFIPIIILSIWLASVYSRYKTNGGVYDSPDHRSRNYKNDNDFDYYQGFDDRAPISADGKKGNKSYSDYHKGGKGALLNSRNSRYDDMAPKYQNIAGHR